MTRLEEAMPTLPVVTITGITRGGRVRWHWSVAGNRGGDSGEERTREAARRKADAAKRRWQR